jgi:hypothetical protein
MSIIIPIKGGKSYTRIYENIVDYKINNIIIIINNINLCDNNNFYINQLRNLFRNTDLEFLYGNNEYQQYHDLYLIYTYLIRLIYSNSYIPIINFLELDEPLITAIKATNNKLTKYINIFNEPMNIPKPTNFNTSNIDSMKMSIKDLTNILITILETNKTSIKKIQNNIINFTTNIYNEF